MGSKVDLTAVHWAEHSVVILVVGKGGTRVVCSAGAKVAKMALSLVESTGFSKVVGLVVLSAALMVGRLAVQLVCWLAGRMAGAKAGAMAAMTG